MIGVIEGYLEGWLNFLWCLLLVVIGVLLVWLSLLIWICLVCVVLFIVIFIYFGKMVVCVECVYSVVWGVKFVWFMIMWLLVVGLLVFLWVGNWNGVIWKNWCCWLRKRWGFFVIKLVIIVEWFMWGFIMFLVVWRLIFVSEELNVFWYFVCNIIF